MRLALQNPFDPLGPSAERELVERIAIAARRKGWHCRIIRTADEIEAMAPDAVVSLHHEAPKLTEFPTFGCLWNPPVFFQHDQRALDRVLSYDGFLVAGPGMERFVRDMVLATGKPVHTAPFYPTTHALALEPAAGPDSRLFYVGANWDGRRYAAVLRELAAAGVLLAFGAEERWRHLDAGYGGPLPFDGETLIRTAHRCGIGLCLHLPAHAGSGIPNMRIFELAAAGAVAVSDRHPFVVDTFGDSVLYVDTGLSDAALAAAIAAHVDWVRAHPAEARAMAARAQAVFLNSLTLDRLLDPLPDLTARVRESCGFARPAAEWLAMDGPAAEVEFVVRVRAGAVEALQATLASLAAQSHARVSVVLAEADGAPGAEVGSPLPAQRPDVPPLAIRRVRGGLWPALQALMAPWFGVLEAGTVLHPNHVASLLRTAAGSGASLVVADAVRREPDEAGGGRTLMPAGTLAASTDPATPAAIVPAATGALLARRHLLSAPLLRDPALDTLDGVYLLRRLLDRAVAMPSRLVTLSWPASGHAPGATEEAPRIERLERYDPWRSAAPQAGSAAPGAVAARPRLAVWSDLGSPLVASLPILDGPRAFAALPTDRPVYIYGSSRGGRLVQLELMKHPGIDIAGFLDSERDREAWGLPCAVPGRLPPAVLASATIVIASQHVSEIARALTALGDLRVFNAFPYIASYTDPP